MINIGGTAGKWLAPNQGVTSISQGRAQGILSKIGITEQVAPTEAWDATGEVNLYRQAVARANGFQLPIRYAIKFNPPLGINQPNFIPGRGSDYDKKKWVQSNPKSYVRGGSIDYFTQVMNHSGSGYGSGTIRYLYEDAAQACLAMWQPVPPETTYIGMISGDDQPEPIERKDTVLNLFCSKVSIPEKSLNFASMRHYGTHFAYPQSVSYGSMSTTFYCDASMKIKKFFDAWQKLIYNDITGNFNYYDEYTSSFDVFTRAGVATDKFYDNPSKKSNIFKRGTEKLNEWTGNAGPKKNAIKIPMMEFRNTYGVQIMECWPQIVGAIDLGHTSTNSVAEFSVTWVYKKWNTFNLGEITKRGRTINLSSGIYLDEGDGLPILRDLPQELQGPLNARMDQQAMQSPIINAARITG